MAFLSHCGRPGPICPSAMHAVPCPAFCWKQRQRPKRCTGAVATLLRRECIATRDTCVVKDRPNLTRSGGILLILLTHVSMEGYTRACTVYTACNMHGRHKPGSQHTVSEKLGNRQEAVSLKPRVRRTWLVRMTVWERQTYIQSISNITLVDAKL